MAFKKGSFVAIKSYEDPYFIAQCLEDIPDRNSSRKYKIKWLERTEDKSSLLYTIGYEDRVRRCLILSTIKLEKKSKSVYSLSLEWESKILDIIIQNSSEKRKVNPSENDSNKNNQWKRIKNSPESTSDYLPVKEIAENINDPANHSPQQGITKNNSNKKNHLNKINNSSESTAYCPLMEERTENINDPANLSPQQVITELSQSELREEIISDSELNKYLHGINNSSEYIQQLNLSFPSLNEKIVIHDIRVIRNEGNISCADVNDVLKMNPNKLHECELVSSIEMIMPEDESSSILPHENKTLNSVSCNAINDCLQEQFVCENRISNDNSSTKLNESSLPLSHSKSISPLHSEYLPSSETSIFSDSVLTSTKIESLEYSTNNSLLKTHELESSHSSVDTPQVQTTLKTDQGKRVYNKRHCCYFCNKLVSKLTRHLVDIHSNETEVVRLLAMAPKSKERKEGLLCLLRIGDYFYNCEILATKKGTLILSRRPAHKSSYTDYGPCPKCLGFFLLKQLWHHVKYGCPDKSTTKKENTHKDIRGDSIALLDFHSVSEGYKRHILASFKIDAISEICKTDEILLRFGNMLFEKYSAQQHEYLRQTLRQMSRLLIRAREISPEIHTISDLLQPRNFDTVIASVRSVCQSAKNCIMNEEFEIPSLALKIGHSLRKCALILRGISLRKGDLKADRNMQGFISLMEIEWRNRISAAALRTLKERKLNTTQLLPLTADIIKLSQYIDNQIESLLNNILDAKTDWYRLASLTLSRIILLNKRRSGEASKMTLNHYATRPNWKEQCTEELKKTLSPLEICLADKMTIIEVPGKSRAIFKVPILLTEQMKKAIDKLIQLRDEAEVNKKNIYVFARSSGSTNFLRGHDCLRKVCKEVELEKPEWITGTKLRKYIATVVQVFNLSETEYDWLARHLGHDIRVHREFYRMHESAVELTKISRLLLAVDKGEVNIYKGKSIADINVGDLPDIEVSGSDSENDNENDQEQHLTNINLPVPTIKKKENEKQNKPKTKWGSEEKKAVLQFFNVNIKKEIVPNMADCKKCKEKYADELERRSWREIKYCVYNHIKSLRKIKK